MSPKLKLKDVVFTLADIINCDYPEQWSRAQALARRLAELQEKVLPALPGLHQQLPADVKQLQDSDAQMALQTYILARSLYAFADKVFRVLDEQCTVLAMALNASDRYAEEDALAVLECTLDVLDHAPLEAIASDPVLGLQRLSDVTHQFEHRLDFIVFHKERADWSFHDIMGTIADSGLCREDLLQDAINCTLSTCVLVGKLLDDDTMQRVY